MRASEGDALVEDQDSSGNWMPLAAALCSIPLLFGLVRQCHELFIVYEFRCWVVSQKELILFILDHNFPLAGNNCADSWHSCSSIHTTSFHHIPLGQIHVPSPSPGKQPRKFCKIHYPSHRRRCPPAVSFSIACPSLFFGPRFLD